MDKRLYRSAKRLNNKSGETIVEAVVSFIILLLILLAVGQIIRTATSLNKHGKDVSENLENAIQVVETDSGKVVDDTAKMMINLEGDLAIGRELECPIVIKSAEPFVYFVPKAGGTT